MQEKSFISNINELPFVILYIFGIELFLNELRKMMFLEEISFVHVQSMMFTVSHLSNNGCSFHENNELELTKTKFLGRSLKTYYRNENFYQTLSNAVKLVINTFGGKYICMFS